MWFDDAVIYQIYPLGLCGAPLKNEGPDPEHPHRILRLLDWVEHIKNLGATCVFFFFLFESDAHGYDTRDYTRVDCRLGSGLEVLQPEEADDIIIAGMGAETILEILDAAPWVSDERYNLVLVPATKHSLLRLGLARRGFALLDETLAYAAGRWYAVMNARFDGDRHTPDAWHCLTGKTPGQPGFASYCAQQRPKLKKYRLGLDPGPEAQAVDALIERLEGNL